MINKSFDKYLVGDQKKKVAQIATEINMLYEKNEYKLYEQQIDSYATLENLSIEVKSLQDELLYACDHMDESSGMNGMGGMGGMHGNMMTRPGMTPGEYVEETFILTQNNKQAGTIIIGYIDNSYLTESALLFKNTLTKILFIAAIVAVAIGLFTSILLASSLTKPLINIRNTALEMQKGNLTKQAKPKTNITEINDLSNSINYLSETLSNQETIRKKYASDISHELRTPLSTLKSHVEAIMDGIWEPSQEHLAILMSEINRLASLVDDLKGSFNASEHGIILNKTQFDLSDEIEKVVTTFMPIFNSQNIAVIDTIEKNIMVTMDLDKIKQVMYNLLSNAVKHTPKEGTIYISIAKKESNKVLIIIKDTGIGIDAKHLPFIFNRFYKVDEARNIASSGTGLGLAIVKTIVEEHGGEIELTSVYGEGTQFTLLFQNNTF